MMKKLMWRLSWATVALVGSSGSSSSAQREIDTHSFLIKWPSQVRASDGVFSFTLSVQQQLPTTAEAEGEFAVPPPPFETGLVWRENTTVRGAAACCGNATWVLRAGASYQWHVQEYVGQPAQPVGGGVHTGRFTTSASLPTPREEARRETFAAATNRVFNDTAASLAGRTKANGFFGESPFAGEYGSAEFTRTIGAAVAAFLELGDDRHAHQILRLILDLHKVRDAPFPSHTIGCTPLNTSNISRCGLGMIEQTDGSFHLILAWSVPGLYCGIHTQH